EDRDVASAPEAICAQLDLSNRRLAGDEQCPPRRADRDQRGEQEGRLADAGLAADEDERRGHEAAPEHPVELVHSRRDPPRLLDLDVDEAQRRPRRRGLGGAEPLLGERPEGTAAGAAAEPAPAARPALGARVLDRRRLRHETRVRGAADGNREGFATIAAPPETDGILS